jgi:hypothetical protein
MKILAMLISVLGIYFKDNCVKIIPPSSYLFILIFPCANFLFSDPSTWKPQKLISAFKWSDSPHFVNEMYLISLNFQSVILAYFGFYIRSMEATYLSKFYP